MRSAESSLRDRVEAAGGSLTIQRTELFGEFGIDSSSPTDQEVAAVQVLLDSQRLDTLPRLDRLTTDSVFLVLREAITGSGQPVVAPRGSLDQVAAKLAERPVKRGGLAVLLVALFILYFNGNLDRTLEPMGLNFKECARNAFGATFCGDDLDEYEERVINPFNEAQEELERGLGGIGP